MRTDLVVTLCMILGCICALAGCGSCGSGKEKTESRPGLSGAGEHAIHDLRFVSAFERVTAILPLENRIFAGSRSGIHVFNTSTNRLQHMTFSAGSFFPAITDMITDRRGTVWVGTDAGLAHIEGNNCSYLEESRLPVEKMIYRDGRLWCLTPDKQVFSITVDQDESQIAGRSLRREKKDSWSHFLFFSIDEGGELPDKRRLLGYNYIRDSWQVISATLPNGSIHDLHVWQGKIWGVLYDRIGDNFRSYGITCFDGSRWLSESMIDFPISLEKQKWSLLEVRSEILYITSDLGLLVMRTNGATYHPYPIGSGLENNRILSLGIGRDTIWCGTERGIGYFDGQDWFYNDFISAITDNHIRALSCREPWVLVETAKGASLYNMLSDFWMWEWREKSSYALTISSRSRSPMLFKLKRPSGHNMFLKFDLGKAVTPHNWAWEIMPPSPAAMGDIKEMKGDYTGNVWIRTSRYLWRFAGDRWFCYDFSMKETLSHKYIQVEDIKPGDSDTKQTSSIVVERCVAARDRTWFLIQGRGWKAVLHFKEERWNLQVLKERFSSDMTLVGADDAGIWVQEKKSLIRYPQQQGREVWKDDTFQFLKVHGLVNYGNRSYFSLSGLRTSSPVHEFYRIVDEQVGRIDGLFDIVFPELNVLCRVQNEIWAGSPHGIAQIGNMFHSSNKGSSPQKTKKVVVSGRISRDTIGEPVNVRGTVAPALLPSLSPDDKKMVYVQSDEAERLVMIHDLDTNHSRILFNERGLKRTYKPSFSPDGETILFYGEKNADEEIFAYHLSSNQLQRLTRSRGKDWDPVFSSTGNEVYFTSDRWGSNDIYVLAISTKKTRRLTTEKSSEWHVTVSPDGEFLAYVRSDNRNPGDIWLMRSDGTEARPLVMNPEKDWLPCWSPDGKYIAFSSFKSNFHHIYVIDLDDSQQTQVTAGPYNDLAPTWTEDGRYIYFHTDRNQPRDIWKVRVR